MNNRLSFHYQQELALVYQLIEEFAQAHPKIAARLRLDGKNIADPETARLLQTFALSNARLSYNLDDNFSFLSDTLLNSLHPHLYAPLPAFSIVQFQPNALKLNHHVNLKKHLSLQPAANNDEQCFFRTCYDVDIFPVKITEVELISQPAVMPVVYFLNQTNAFLRIRLEGLDDKIHLAKSGIEKLRLFIDLPTELAYKLYELIFDHYLGAVVVSHTTDTAPVLLPLSDIQAVGFHPDEEILPYSQTTGHPYRLQIEFFAFPEKFLFFEINNLCQSIAQKCTQAGQGVEIIIYLDQSNYELEKILKPDHLKLFCTPVVNLFDAETARIEINPKQEKYLLPTDKNLEIYQVHQVTVVYDDQQEKILSDSDFHVLRRPSWEAGDYLKIGSESFLYFQTSQNLFNDDKYPQISSKLLCTNRELPAELNNENKNMLLTLVENKTDVLKAICFIKKILPPTRPFMQPELGWQYLSSLHLNYFSLTDDQDGLCALRNLLAIYIPDTRVKNKAEILSGLLAFRTQMVTLRSSRVRENCFCQGIKIRMHLDEAKFESIGVYLFCQILSRFFTAWFSKNLPIILVVLSSTGKVLFNIETQKFASLWGA